MSTLADPLKGAFANPLEGAFANDRLDKSSTRSLGVAGGVDLYWLPLGAGGRSVRLNGRVFEWLSALRAHRSPLALYHAALEVRVDEGRYVIEMTPEGKGARERHDLVGGGAVGSRWAGRLRLFRYELRCWRDGTIPDVGEAVGSPVHLSVDPQLARSILDHAPSVPDAVWGRDELAAGEMWTSNSVTSWLLVGAGIDVERIRPPSGGRAPGWDAGVVVARRSAAVVPRSAGTPAPRKDGGVLPELVQSYLDRNVLIRKQADTVRFTQLGEMQLKPGRWSSFRAEQEMAVDRVEFAWHANFHNFAPLVSVRVRDWYRAGRGCLSVRLWNAIPIVNAGGEAVARGEAMRYLAELPLVPQAMIANSALLWRTIDESTVEVATDVGQERVAVSLHFDGDGDIVAMSAATRERGVGKKAVATPWSGKFGEYREFDGARVPTKAEASWLSPEGPFTYFRCTIDDWHADQSR